MSEQACYLSFPDDELLGDVAGRLRIVLESEGVRVLPPLDDETSSITPFYWMRLADVVVLDMTHESTWVAFEAGAAKALNRTLLPVSQSSAKPSEIGRQLPRTLLYEPDQIAALADYVKTQIVRGRSAKS